MSAAADCQLLRSLLDAAADKPIDLPVESPPDDSALLRHLLDVEQIPPRRPQILFEALNALQSECLHSDYLAWLLDPMGPLEDMWLLKKLMGRISPDVLVDDSAMVEREVWIKDGRLDIQVTFDSFMLIIENKVWSSEGERQGRVISKVPRSILPPRAI